MNSVLAKKNFKFKWVLFFLHPILAISYSFKKLRVKDTANLIWAFLVFFGWTMVPYLESKDSSAYRNKLDVFYNNQEAKEAFVANLYELGGDIDVFIQTLIYLMSFVTDNGSLLYALFGFVFGYFYSRNFKFILEISAPFKHKRLIIYLLVCLLLVIPFWSINGVRFWTAAHMAIWCILSYFKQNQNKYVIYLLLTPLVHFSFVFVILAFLIWKFTKLNNIKFLLFIFVLTYIFSNLSTGFLVELIKNYAPSFAGNEVEAYTHEDLINSSQIGRVKSNWYVQYFGDALRLGVYTMFFMLTFKHAKLVFNNDIIKKLTIFTLIFGSLCNLISVIPSAGRFTSLSVYLLLFLSILFIVKLMQNQMKPPKMLVFSNLILLFWLIVNIRDGFDYISFGTFTNPLLSMFEELNTTPIINLIK